MKEIKSKDTSKEQSQSRQQDTTFDYIRAISPGGRDVYIAADQYGQRMGYGEKTKFLNGEANTKRADGTDRPQSERMTDGTIKNVLARLQNRPTQNRPSYKSKGWTFEKVRSTDQAHQEDGEASQAQRSSGYDPVRDAWS